MFSDETVEIGGTGSNAGSENIYVSVLPDVPAAATTSAAPEELDFDDLAKRFEALKKK